MAFSERVNKRTKQKEYKYRYYFIQDGKKRDSETAWFPSKEEAKREGERLKEIKERADRTKTIIRRDTHLITAYEHFVKSLEDEANSKKTTTAVSNFRLANTIKKKYIPDHIQRIPMKDITALIFRQWLAFINSQEGLGGRQVRQQKTILKKFNNWLAENGYYASETLDVEVDVAISKVKLKEANAHNREREGKRHTLTIFEVMRIITYYHSIAYRQNIGIFKNLYWQTLFTVLFFTGVRVEELVALQWKSIILKKKQIHIVNAISEKEPRDTAIERTKAGEYKTKNPMSVRVIPIFDYYYLLLMDYRRTYKYHFRLTEEEMNECFVFPNISKKDPYQYQGHKNILREVHSVCETLKIEHTDSQMFRHSCATFLILPPPDGLNFTESKVKDYFGHEDTEMLTHIYARLTQQQKADRLRDTFKDFSHQKIEKSLAQEHNQSVIDDIINPDSPTVKKRHEGLIMAQLREAEHQKKKEYYYILKDQYIIDAYKAEKPDTAILFVEVAE